jgi:hypothetical protein
MTAWRPFVPLRDNIKEPEAIVTRDFSVQVSKQLSELLYHRPAGSIVSFTELLGTASAAGHLAEFELTCSSDELRAAIHLQGQRYLLWKRQVHADAWEFGVSLRPRAGQSTTGQ